MIIKKKQQQQKNNGINTFGDIGPLMNCDRIHIFITTKHKSYHSFPAAAFGNALQKQMTQRDIDIHYI